jgi:hypothetical protein
MCDNFLQRFLAVFGCFSTPDDEEKNETRNETSHYSFKSNDYLDYSNKILERSNEYDNLSTGSFESLDSFTESSESDDFSFESSEYDDFSSGSTVYYEYSTSSSDSQSQNISYADLNRNNNNNNYSGDSNRKTKMIAVKIKNYRKIFRDALYVRKRARKSIYAKKETAKDIKEKQMAEALSLIAHKVFFEVNSSSNMKENQFDFHCQRVQDAPILADWLVKEVLPFKKGIEIITGRGIHSRNGKSGLRETTLKYFNETLGINCNIDKSNSGILVVSK